MIESLRRRMLHLLRIPAFPHLPPGEEQGAKVFRADRAFYHLQLLRWSGRQLGAAVGLVLGFVFIHLVQEQRIRVIFGPMVLQMPWLFLGLEFLAVAGFLVQLPFSFLAVRWDYECRFYVLSDRCLRIQEGIWTFREQTFTLANIQNLDVHQGPLQRLLGLSDLVVRTAGGGETSEEHEGPSLHEGRLRGLGDATEVKARILAQMKRYRDAGLGDPDLPAVPEMPAAEGLEQIARQAAEAARAVTARLLA